MTTLDRIVAVVLIVSLFCGMLGLLALLAESRRFNRWLSRHCRWIELEASWLRFMP